MTDERWRNAQREQRQSIARETTAEQRIAWLEEAIELARVTGALERALREHDQDLEGRRST